jgi:hypothetical protein
MIIIVDLVHTNNNNNPLFRLRTFHYLVRVTCEPLRTYSKIALL